MTAPEFDVSRLLALRRVEEVVSSPDGTYLAVALRRLSQKGDRFVTDLWKVPTGGGEPVRLTRGECNDRAPRFRRDGALAFLSDRKVGDEGEGRSRLWLIEPGGGEPELLVDEPIEIVGFDFTREADVLVVLSRLLPGVPFERQRRAADERKERGPSALSYRRLPVRHWDRWLGPAFPHLLRFDAQGNGREDLTPSVGRELEDAAFAVLPDGTAVATTWAEPGPDGIDSTRLRRIDLRTKAAVDLTPLGTERFGPPVVSWDGRHLAALRERRAPDRAPEAEVCLLPASGGPLEVVTLDPRLWPQGVVFGGDSDTLLLWATEGWTTPVFRVDLDAGAGVRKVVRITPVEAGGSHHGLASVPGEARFYGIRHSLFSPPEPFGCRAEPGAKPEPVAALSGWSEAEAKGWCEVERLSVEVPSGTEVEVGLLRPSGNGPFPLVTWIHGGPFSAWGDLWHWRWNPLFFVARGYAVALPNPAGSVGYGPETTQRIWGNVWGAACYQDLMAVQDALESRAEIDASRTAAMGGSFGGYMANWIGTQTDRYRCLVSHAGLYDLRAFFGTTDHPAYFALEMGGPPWRLGPELDTFSPAAHVERWRTPVLILHGQRDYRVPLGQALALFSALTTLGVDAELVVFPDENHWIDRPRNIVDWYARCAAFLDRHLGVSG